MPSHATQSTTLYPKITNHISQVIEHLKAIYPLNTTIPPLPLTGTVKLHGTHADILIHTNNTIIFQSRNIVGLDSTKDNSGFATHMSRRKKALLRLRDILLARYQYLYPYATLDTSQPVLIAGEWIGQNIQKHVAISTLSKRFVLISLHINGHWVRDADFSAISLPNHDIYNASRAGAFNGILYPDDPQRTIDQLTPLAEQVARHCPFAATFGVDGEGEGVVWKISSTNRHHPHEHHADSELWFKTKGGRFRPTFVRAPPPRQSPEAGERNRELAAETAEVWCSEIRLQQGWDYVAEMGVHRDMKGLGLYLKWVQNDVLTEEKGYINNHRVDVASLKIEIAKIARPWYVCRIKSI